VDGHSYNSHATPYAPDGYALNGSIESVRELHGGMRRGKASILDEELRSVPLFYTYSVDKN